MNNCILMAEIIKEPQLRYTADNQTQVAEMLVQFPGAKAEDPPATLKVVAWRNMATEMQERYHEGDRVVIFGYLSMNTIERPEGFKEKRAELTASQIHPMGGNASFAIPAPAHASASTATSNNVVSLGARRPVATPEHADRGMSMDEETPDSFSFDSTPHQKQTSVNPDAGQDLDDIPF